MSELPILRARDFPAQYRQPQRTSLADLGRLYDYAIGAPTRRFIQSSGEGKGLGRTLYDMGRQYFRPPEESPSWTDLAESAGLPRQSLADLTDGRMSGTMSKWTPAGIGGFAGESIFDPTNLATMGGAGIGMMLGKNAKNFSRAKGKMSALWDKKQRFEISDAKADIKDDWIFQSDFDKDYKLSDVLDHPELYKEYPELKNIPLNVDDNISATAEYLPGGNITLNMKKIGKLMDATGEFKKPPKEALLHEIQHVIQDIEGFARGGSPSDFQKSEYLTKAVKGNVGNKIKMLFDSNNKTASNLLKNNPEKYKDKINAYRKANRMQNKKDFPDNEILGAILTEADDEYKYLSELNRQAWENPLDSYQRLAGEAEARDASARMNMTPAQRRRTQPLESTGLSLGDLIVR